MVSHFYILNNLKKIVAKIVEVPGEICSNYKCNYFQ
jgi:hypothetical protein